MSGHESRLMAKVAELEEAVRQLYALLRNEAWTCPPELGLTLAERNVLSALVARPMCTVDFLSAVGSPKGIHSEATEKATQVRIVRIRKKLRPHHLVVRTSRGIGYYLEPESRTRLQNWGKETT